MSSRKFDVSGGPLPEADQLVLKALQGYSDGDIVRWIEEPVAGQAEPEHPAPVLKLAKAASGDGNGGVQVSATAGPAAAGPSDGKGAAALVIGVIALLMAGAALGLVFLDRRRSVAS